MGNRPYWTAVFLALFTQTAVADPVRQVDFTSHSAHKSYGLYLAAPAGACTFVRYHLSGQGLRAQTIALRAGEGQLVRLGAGFAPGDYSVRIAAKGCQNAPSLARTVVLRKASPDHGARALSYIKADALRERQG